MCRKWTAFVHRFCLWLLKEMLRKRVRLQTPVLANFDNAHSMRVLALVLNRQFKSNSFAWLIWTVQISPDRSYSFVAKEWENWPRRLLSCCTLLRAQVCVCNLSWGTTPTSCCSVFLWQGKKATHCSIKSNFGSCKRETPWRGFVPEAPCLHFAFCKPSDAHFAWTGLHECQLFLHHIWAAS